MANKTNIIIVGKKTKFLNLIKVNNEADIQKFPENVRKAISYENGSIRVDSCEYAEGEIIPFGSYIAWEPYVHENCPHGFNLWCKGNAQEQLDSGILEEVNGKYRQTKIVPYQAQLFTGEIPEIFVNAPTFEGQVKVEDMLYLETPWGTSSCEVGKGFAIVYGTCAKSDDIAPKFHGMLDANILTVGTATFEDYYLLTEEGTIISTLKEYYDSI